MRKIGVIDGSRPVPDNDREDLIKGGDRAVARRISDQMRGRSCTIVLVGAAAANRKSINYEILRSWNDGMGVVGIRIHGLKDAEGQTAVMGRNPFDGICVSNSGTRLSRFVTCHDPSGSTSQERYDWISNHLANAVEEAISVRQEA